MAKKKQDVKNCDPKQKEIEERICEVCEIEVIFNTHIYDITGMCGTCSTGEARLNYEED